MDCCFNDLGLKPHNQDVDLREMAAQSGEYKFVLDFNGTKTTKRKTFEAGDDLLVPQPFNEDFIYNLTVVQPDGTNLLVDGCERFIFKTYISMDESQQCNDCEEQPGGETYY